MISLLLWVKMRNPSKRTGGEACRLLLLVFAVVALDVDKVRYRRQELETD